MRAFLIGGLGGLAIGLVGHGLKNGIHHGFSFRESIGIAAGVVIGIVVVFVVRHLRETHGGGGKPIQSAQHNAGSRPSSDDSPSSDTPSSLGPRG